MGIEGVGSSVVIALAAVLWLVYLIPTWFRRREYLSTERNAVRLQQTLRVLAETAEVPETVHIEATARSVAAQQRLLRHNYERAQAIARAKEAVMTRAATRTLASLAPEVASGVVTHSSAARRLRRSRACTTAVLVLAVATIAIGLRTFAAGPSMIVVASGSLVAVAAFALLSVMAVVGRARSGAARELRQQPVARRSISSDAEASTAEHEAPSGWTPVPLPKPLYLSKPAPQTVVPDATLAETRARLLAEAEEAERLLREAERAEKVTPIIRPAAASRFARMGIIDEAESTVTNLDDVLRRRRAV